MVEKFTIQQYLKEMKKKHLEYQEKLISGCKTTVAGNTSSPTSLYFSANDVQAPSIESCDKTNKIIPSNDSGKKIDENKTIKRQFLRKGKGKLASTVHKSVSKSLLQKTLQNPVSTHEQSSTHSSAFEEPFIGKKIAKKQSIDSNKVRASCKSDSLRSSLCTVYWSSSESCNEFCEPGERRESDNTLDKKDENINKYLCNSHQKEDSDDEKPCWANNSIELSLIKRINAEEQRNEKEAKELEVFEILEERMNNVSFCSSSSLVTRLMEPSVKSTPKKDPNNLTTTQEEQSYEVEKERVVEKKVQFPCECGYADDDDDDDDADDADDTEYVNHSISNKVASTKSTNQICNEKEYSISKFNDFIQWEDSECSDLCCLPSSLPYQGSNFSKENPSKVAEKMVTLASVPLTSNFPNSSVETAGYNLNDQEAIYLKDKVKDSVLELSAHVDILKKELKDLVSKKEKYVSDIKKFEKEKQKMLHTFEEQKKEFETFQEEERKKLRKERTTLEKYSKTLRNQSKFNQQTQEIKLLKEELSAIQEELKDKQKSFGVVTSSLRVQIHTLLTKINDLSKSNESLVKELNSLKNHDKRGGRAKELSLKKNKPPSALENVNDYVDAVCASTVPQVVQIDTKGVIDENCVPIFGSANNEHIYPIDCYASERHILDISTHTLPTTCNRLSLTERLRNMNISYDSLKDGPVDFIKNCPIRQIISSGTNKTEYEGSEIVSYPDCREEWHFSSGETVYQNSSDTVVLYPNGEVEITDGQLAVHYFQDGSFKTVHADGSTETVYPNNRIRIRNGAGNLILDSNL